MKHPQRTLPPATLHPADRQRGFISSRQSLVLLGLLFVAPVLVAWLMHMSGEGGWRPEGTTNRGTLVQPPRPLTLPAGLSGAAGEAIGEDYLRGKWTLLYIDDADCTEACVYNLYKMRQVRLSQGENIRRVQRLFLVAEAASLEPLQAALAENPQLKTALLSREQVEALAPRFAMDEAPVPGAERVYLVDPLGNLMMYYQPDAEPRGMIKDLQKLLKYSRIG